MASHRGIYYEITFLESDVIVGRQTPTGHNITDRSAGTEKNSRAHRPINLGNSLGAVEVKVNT